MGKSSQYLQHELVGSLVDQLLHQSIDNKVNPFYTSAVANFSKLYYWIKISKKMLALQVKPLLSFSANNWFQG